MGPQECTAKDARQPKHEDLARALYDLRTVKAHLGDLLNKVAHGNAPAVPDGGPDIEMPSLRDLLDGTPSEVRGHISDMHQLIDELDSQLF